MIQVSRRLALALVGLTSLAVLSHVEAGTFSSSTTAPTAELSDLANYAAQTGGDKWFFQTANEAGVSDAAKGQTFTSGSTRALLKGVTFKITAGNMKAATTIYTIRLGTISGTSFTLVASENATQTVSTATGAYMTWRFSNPALLATNTLYGVDVAMKSSVAWQTGIPYLAYSANSGNSRIGLYYDSGDVGVGGATITTTAARDRIFHLDMEDPMRPSPAHGATVLAGNVPLSWVNVAANVYVDVWFGTNSAALNQIVTGGFNTTNTTVNAPLAATYYWRVNTYTNGAPTGTPITGTLFRFIVTDADNDGLPDAYEMAYTSPPSATALNPGDDLDVDGLTNLQEYQRGTIPTNADTDGDTLKDGAEVTGVAPRPATNPLLADTDGDSLNDGVENNTGTWLNSTNRGTNPTKTDTDFDGLEDGVENNTGNYVSLTSTGTSPLLPDSDGDGAGDWYEVAGAFTGPTNPDSKPNVPYPLPDPGATPPATNKPVKVFVLMGQSNMVGIGDVPGTDPGTLDTITKREGKFPNLLTAANAWTTRNDVTYKGVVTATAAGPLTAGQGSDSTTLGPELGFGHVMGYYFDEPVLLLKSSEGNRSLGWDFLPPGSPRHTNGTTVYAGYGETPASWNISNTSPTPIAWYAGKQFDDCVIAATNVLKNFNTLYPQYAAQGYQVAGFVWWQGHKDSQDAYYAGRYERNLTNFIRQIRAKFNAPNAPFILGGIGFYGWGMSGNYLTVCNAQLAMTNTVKYPQFAGNVSAIETRGYWRTAAESPDATQDYHYYKNAETYMLVGDALGRGMIDLLIGADYSAWAAKFPSANLTNQNADFDGDGANNNYERIWGLNPTNAASQNLFPSTSGLATGNFSYTRRAQSLTGLNYTVWTSPDLVTWTQDTGSVQTPGAPVAEVETVSVTLSPGLLAQTRLFVRMRAD